ncbi:MAG: DUF4173 domain-containing protein [Vicingaceae bacterium]
MKNKLLLLFELTIALFIFDALFWQEGIGQNLLYFTMLLSGLSIRRAPALSKEVLFAFSAMLISCLMVVWHNSGLSISMLIISSMVFLGFVKQKEVTTVWEGFLGFMLNYISQPIAYFRSLNTQKSNSPFVNFFFRFFKVGIIPLLLVFLFFIIYQNANPKFEALTHSFTQFIAELFVDFSLAHFLFLLFGFSLIALALKSNHIKLSPFIQKSDVLLRQKRNVKLHPLAPKSSLLAELLAEHKIGLLLLAGLNLLLLVVNIIDIQWIWFGFEVPLDFNLKQFVHEGTYLLILSILISIGIVLYFFRGSLNFYPKNKTFVMLGKLWVIQNLILTLSVFWRNYHYIDYHGLAGKRIGVIVFLTMVIFGLVTLFIKVNKRKTAAYLLRINGWFILFTLVLTSCLHWDRVIVTHNLNHDNPAEIDVDYYLQLSPTVYPILFKNLDIVEEQMQAHLARQNKTQWITYTDIDLFESQLEYKTSVYLNRINKNGWPSWNFADAQLEAKTVVVE